MQQHPEAVLSRISSELSSIISLVELNNPLPVDQKLGYVKYMLDQLDTTSETNRILFQDIHTHVDDLQRRAITALVAPIWAEEKSKWVANLDAVSTMARTRSDDMGFRMDQLRTNDTVSRQAKRQIHAANDWQGKLEVVQNLLGQKGVPAPVVSDTANMARQVVRVGQTQEDREFDVWRDAVARPGELLGDDDAFGIVHHNIAVLLHGRISRKAEQDLLARGMTIKTVFQHYTVINNCRLLGVSSSILPGAAMFTIQIADDLLAKAQAINPNLAGYVLAKTYRAVKGNHTYFPLLPGECTLAIKSWELVKETSRGR